LTLPSSLHGIAATGKEYVKVIPPGSPIGNLKPIEHVSQVWISEELQLPVFVRIHDAVHGETTMRYRNFRTKIDSDPGLFQVPAGFEVLPGPAVVPQ
jgi:hypothetical protein